MEEAKQEVQEQKPLTEKEKGAIMRQRNAYKKNLKEDVEILELEIKWLQYSLAKPRLEMDYYRMNNPVETPKPSDTVAPTEDKIETPVTEDKEDTKVVDLKGEEVKE